MKRLWAPWRKSYVENVDNQKDCFLCEAVSQKEDSLRDYLVLYKGKFSFVIFNKYPYNAGHLMVAPIAHIGNFIETDEEIALEIHRLTKVCILALKETIKPQGFNIGYNLGRAAGAGLETHIHLHIVPRWNGDTNFMPIVGSVKVISQDLYELYDRIKPVFYDILDAFKG